jgi:hypothetical protein
LRRCRIADTPSPYRVASLPTITVENDPHFDHRLAGHLENGEDSISDPAMGGLV